MRLTRVRLACLRSTHARLLSAHVEDCALEVGVREVGAASAWHP